MTKEQLESKLALLPLLTAVNVSLGVDDDEVTPRLFVTWFSVPGPGSETFGMSTDPTPDQLKALAYDLPLAQQDRLASLAILL